jgi:hypothetical protein
VPREYGDGILALSHRRAIFLSMELNSAKG